MYRNYRSVLITLFLLYVALAATASAQADKVDEFIKAEMAKRKIPGLSLAVVKNGEVIKAQGYGLANIELNVPATADTIYQSGSVGKQFTSAAVMLLVEEGKINLDDKISKYLDGTPEIWKEITVRHLLTHTSGIKNYGDKDIDYRQDYTDEEIIKVAAGFPLDFQPGEKWSYSNTGYVLLGYVIKKAAGKFYGDFLKERVFGPLGMKTARVINEEDIILNRAAGYRRTRDGEIKNQRYVSPSLNTTADGSLYFTVLDMAKWDAALYSEKLLKQSSIDQMWTPVKLNGGKTFHYGFGWGIGEFNKHKLIEHGGAWQGFTTHISRYVDDKLTIIVLTNLAGANPGAIAHKVVGFYIPELMPAEKKAIKIDPTIFDAYVGEYQFSPTFTVTVSREGEKFMAQATRQPKLELFAESETKFFLTAIDAEMEFVKGEDGKVSHMIFRQEGQVVEAKKIK
ncbi:MAG TPA: serine hydrolase [Blastocatellia bacterium]|nr:serine hydrolase [Blastocatellia bacterium]